MKFIAEIGINHQGKMAVAKKMVEAAKSAGAHIAKFQWYDPDKLLGHDSPFLEEATRCQFSFEDHLELKAHCERIGIEWAVSAFHPGQIPQLVKAGMKTIKIASRAALNDTVISEAINANLPIYLSLGLASQGRLKELAKRLEGRDVTFLYCVCNYPTKPDQIVLEDISRLRSFGNVGFSSHCPDINITLKAIEQGAGVVEHHVVFDRKQPGCDVSSSITFDEFGKLVRESKKLKRHFVSLIPVSTDDQVEWIRVQRSRPEIYRYFRQDAPLSKEWQSRWWRTLDKSSVRLFIVNDENGIPIGHVGFNPLKSSARTAEFGIWIIPEVARKGYGTLAMRQLLRYGFEDLHLSSIYSDTLDYPGENRFEFFKKLGFEAYPKEHQYIRYQKQGKSIPSIKFFITKEMYGKNGASKLEPAGSGSAV